MYGYEGSPEDKQQDNDEYDVGSLQGRLQDKRRVPDSHQEDLTVNTTCISNLGVNFNVVLTFCFSDNV